MSSRKQRRLQSIKAHKLKKQDGSCPRCGDTYDTENQASHRYPTIEHRIPRSKGGTDKASNISVCCRRCNERKADRLPHWMERPAS